MSASRIRFFPLSFPPAEILAYEILELAEAARRLWPGVQAHARKEQPGKRFDEAMLAGATYGN